ncbi:hypothetical protein [Cellulomonas sp. ICMP 17802]|uniref:hypothetical protein n=1 Tax=Cellulomonas sp. ICMP 17802 TaxID=3239199 RepID=UPI00351AC609
MTLPQTPALTDDAFVRSFAPITTAFSGALVVTGLLGALVLVPEPTVTPVGLLVGAVLGLVAWFAPTLVIRSRLTSAVRRGEPPERAHATVRAVVMIGIALAEAPALLGFALAVTGGHDIGSFALSIPLAVASLVLNVSGQGAVRRHLDRLRSTVPY